MTPHRVLGLDFSGNAAMWRPGCRRSNVWLAEATQRSVDGPLVVDTLHQVQSLPGDALPFHRLAARLGRGDFAACGIDAPLGIPCHALPQGTTRQQLIERVSTLPVGRGRDFPKGGALLSLLDGAGLPERGAKVLRSCELPYRRLNVRSTLWNGPRGGAPFTVAALALVGQSGCPCWPWQHAPGMLAEVFPAAQLAAWALPHQRYQGSTAVAQANREAIVAALDDRCQLSAAHRRDCLASADALDAVLCLFGALAAVAGTLSEPLPEPPPIDGWIAVAP